MGCEITVEHRSAQLPLFGSPEPASFAAEVQCALVIESAEPQGKHDPKTLGAYYTDSQVADFLVWWAVRDAANTVLDPSFGGGVFLRAACKRLRKIGGTPGQQVFGIELDTAVHRHIAEKLHEDGVAPNNLLVADFFTVGPERLEAVDVIVGNPPFIRYQRFTGEVRQRALARAAEQGLKLSELSSSWLPFLVHSIRFVRRGGRIAMVIPFEIGHAAYALPVLRHLSQIFERVTFLTFRKKLFPDLSEDTLLLLAEGKGCAAEGQYFIRDLSHAGTLAEIEALNRRPLNGVRRLDCGRISSGEQRIIEYLLPRKARELYDTMRGRSQTVCLGELADVGIGYVTGANEFFHLAPGAASERGIPSEYLRACVRRGRAFAGLRFSDTDWRNGLSRGDAGYLLRLPQSGDLPAPVAAYVADGESRGVNQAFKCRMRSPWYCVPHVYMPDAFLTYMSGNLPRLVANDARVVAPNTLHILRLYPGCGVTRDALAALWQSSLTHLSVEIEGHSLGGGMLKLEPGEAGQVLLPFGMRNDNLEGLAVELDQIARSKGDEACARHADQQLLRRELGLSAADVRLLRDSATLLRERRTSRSVLNERYR
jgi:adenine-specific DNA-methyltransferase